MGRYPILAIAVVAFFVGAASYRTATRIIPPDYKLDGTVPSDAALRYISERQQMFRMSKMDHASIVMLGDSITQHGLWREWTGCDIINRGIGSNTANEVLRTLDDVLSLKPASVYLMIGVNDIVHGRDVDAVAFDIRATLDRIKQSGAKAVWMPTLPVASSFRDGQPNTAISALNSRIEWPETIDVRSFVTNGGGNLKSDLTIDGVHPTATVYMKIVERISCP